jgi:hypothetical protein
MNDPIVDEVRRLREAHAARFNYDLDAIFQDIKEQEKKSGHKFLSGVARQAPPNQALPEWVVVIIGKPRDDLRLSFQHGPIVDDEGRRLLLEHEVDKLNGLKIEVFSDEHPPPHFRIKFGGETNCFRIADAQPMYGDALKQYFRNIKKWHKDNKQVLIDAWNKTRPSDCPVGKYEE